VVKVVSTVAVPALRSSTIIEPSALRKAVTFTSGLPTVAGTRTAPGRTNRE
jgi:hypothetical protein